MYSARAGIQQGPVSSRFEFLEFHQRSNHTYDGRAITWGFASSDEMCIAYFAVTTVPASRSNLDAQSLAARGLPGPEGCKVQSFP